MRSALAGALMAALLIAGGGAALAHAMLDHADPRVGSTVRSAPREVSLTFTQDLEPALSSAQVTNASGERVDDGPQSVSGNVIRVKLNALPAGTYRVQWRAVSRDTHATEGSFTFHVRDRD